MFLHFNCIEHSVIKNLKGFIQIFSNGPFTPLPTSPDPQKMRGRIRPLRKESAIFPVFFSCLSEPKWGTYLKLEEKKKRDEMEKRRRERAAAAAVAV